MISQERSELQALLGSWTGEEVSSPRNPARVYVLEAVRDLADSLQPEPRAANRIVLEVLCRKIDVGKRVYAYYDSDWKKVEQAPELEVQHWPLLAGVLVLHAGRPGGEGQDERGLSLKYLNAAMTAVELGERKGSDRARLETVRRHLVARLDDFMTGGPA